MEAITASGRGAGLRGRVVRATAAVSLALSVGVVGPLSGTALAAPRNDAFPSAQRVVCENFPQINGSNVGATAASGGERLHGFDPGPVDSIWYSWTPNRDRSVTFSTAGSAIDTTLAVYNTGTVPRPGSPVIAEDDDSGPGTTSTVTFTARRGVTYRVAIDGWAGAEGATRLTC